MKFLRWGRLSLDRGRAVGTLYSCLDTVKLDREGGHTVRPAPVSWGGAPEPPLWSRSSPLLPSPRLAVRRSKEKRKTSENKLKKSPKKKNTTFNHTAVGVAEFGRHNYWPFPRTAFIFTLLACGSAKLFVSQIINKFSMCKDKSLTFPLRFRLRKLFRQHKKCQLIELFCPFQRAGWNIIINRSSA